MLVLHLAGAGVRLYILFAESHIGFVHRFEESAAGDSSCRDGIYITAVFADRELTVGFATDDVLTGFVVGAVLAAAIFVIAWLCLRRKN